MLKRCLTIIIICLSLGVKGILYAQSQFSPVIEKMEKSLFGMSYSAQKDEERVKRIEETVYGASSSKPFAQRVTRLSKDLSVESMGQEIKPKADTFADDEDAIKEDIPKADPNVNYPIVNKLEDKVFSKEFKGTDINKRLSALEQKTFNRVYNDDLNTRVERLKASVLGVDEGNVVADSEDEYAGSQTGAAAGHGSLRDLFSRGHYYGPSYNQNNSATDSYEPSDAFNNDLGQGIMDNPQGGGFGNSFDSYDAGNFNNGIGIPLSALEQSVLRKSFPNDTVPNRLTRLEAKVFNSSFAQDDPQTRLDRLSSAHQAKKSSKKYDNNKFSQGASTAIQVGAMLLMVLALIL